METNTAMVEPQSTTTSTATTVETPKVETPEVKEDLVTRVSKVKTEVKAEEPNAFNLSAEDYEKVRTDPVLSKFYKSMQSDYVKKTQKAAEELKLAEKIKQENSNWTPERIQKLLNDPSFVQSAQAVAKSQNPPGSGLTDDQYSALSETEKNQMQAMQNELLQLKQQNFIAQVRQQDEQLKGKYSNYNSQAVDVLTSDLLAGKLNATREHLWKVMDYDDAVNRAYQLGLQDKQVNTQEKVNASSFSGLQTQTPNREVPAVNQGENSQKYFSRLAAANLARMTQQK